MISDDTKPLPLTPSTRPGARQPQAAPDAQTGGQRASQSTTPLHEQGLIDRLMADAHGLILSKVQCLLASHPFNPFNPDDAGGTARAFHRLCQRHAVSGGYGLQSGSHRGGLSYWCHVRIPRFGFLSWESQGEFQ